MYTVVYTVHSKPKATSSLLRTLRKSTKQSQLDHLDNNQENYLEHLKKHILLGQHTYTKIADLDPLKNTQPILANTERKLVSQRIQGLHLLQKIIWNEYKQNPIPQTLINHKLFTISALWKTQKLLAKNLSKINCQICFSEFIQRCSLLANLNKILNCIKRLVKTFNDWSVSS